MGAGNRYTLAEDRETLALYIPTDELGYTDELNPEDFDQESYDFQYDCLIHFLDETFMRMKIVQKYGRCQDSNGYTNQWYYGDSYLISLESGNHGEIVINFEYQNSDPSALVVHNYIKAYHKLCRYVNKFIKLYEGYGYTHGVYEIGQLEKEWKNG